MTDIKKEDIRKKIEELEKEKTRLLEELQEAEEPKDYGSEPEEDEEADEVEEFAAGIAKGQTLRRRISEIDTELEKLRK